MSRTILVVAGEASGDALGAGLIKAAHALDPHVRFSGIGGDEMRRVGAEILMDAGEIAVVGVLEVLARLPRILEARRRLRSALEKNRPARVLLIDYPDFNLRFAREARAAGVPVDYFVSPQIWAWRSGRLRKIARLVSRMMVVFPFEEELYRKAGVPVVFVGHPLIDSEPPILPRHVAREKIGAGPEGRVLALLPGSRRGEVETLLPILLEAASLLQRSRPDLEILIPMASTVPAGLIEGIVASSPARRVRAVKEAFHAVLDAADAAIVASGTATLQAGVRQVPMVVVYRIHPVTAWLGRRLVRVEDIGLVNLVAGRRIVPELVQEQCTPSEIERTIAPLLDDPGVNHRMREALAVVRPRLGPPGAFDRAARVVLDGIDGGGKV